MQIQKTIATLNLFVFSWVGLGTPFIWLAMVDPVNAVFWRGTMSGTLLVLLMSSSLLCLIQFKKFWTLLRDNWLLMIFLAYVFASLLWSPITMREKLLVVLGLGLCCSTAFSSVLSLSLTECFEAIFFSLTAALIPVLVLNTVTHVSYLPVILFALGFSFLAAIVLYFDLFRSYSLLILIIALVLGLVILFNLDLTPFRKVRFLWETGAFSNRNLFNRLVQVLLAMALLISILRGAFSERPRPEFAIAAVLIALLSGFYLALHQASTGQVVLLTVVLTYGAWICVLMNGLINWWRWLFFAICFFTLMTLCLALALAWNFFGVHDQLLKFAQPFLQEYNVAFRFSLWKTAAARLEPFHWIFGAGLDGFWGTGERLATDTARKFAHQAHGHSGFIDLFLQTGLVGVALCLIVLTKALLQVLKYQDFIYAFAWSLLFVLFVSMNLSETAFLPASSASFLSFVLFLWLWVALHQQ